MNFWLDLYETPEQPTSVAKKHLGWAASIGDGRHNIFWYLIYYRTHIYRPLMDWARIGEKENMCRAKDFFKFSSTAKKTLHGYYPELSVGNIGLYQLCPAPPCRLWQIFRGGARHIFCRESRPSRLFLHKSRFQKQRWSRLAIASNWYVFNKPTVTLAATAHHTP